MTTRPLITLHPTLAGMADDVVAAIGATLKDHGIENWYASPRFPDIVIMADIDDELPKTW